MESLQLCKDEPGEAAEDFRLFRACSLLCRTAAIEELSLKRMLGGYCQIGF